jgi:hypothetical protein
MDVSTSHAISQLPHAGLKQSSIDDRHSVDLFEQVSDTKRRDKLTGPDIVVVGIVIACIRRVMCRHPVHCKLLVSQSSKASESQVQGSHFKGLVTVPRVAFIVEPCSADRKPSSACHGGRECRHLSYSGCRVVIVREICRSILVNVETATHKRGTPT